MTQSILGDAELLALLAEDVPYGDLTTAALGINSCPGSLRFSARQDMTLCGIEEAARLLELAGLSVRTLAHSGQQLAAGEPILEAQGSAAALHQGWKVAQVLVETCSGMASALNRIRQALDAAGFTTPLACTRKNFPGTKALSSKAIRVAGGSMHRLGLSETLLIFPEHRLFLAETPAQTVARLQAALPEKKIVVEVKDIEAALEWAQAGAEVLQLEKFTPQALASCRAQLPANRPVLAIAGGVTEQNAVAYAQAGADLLITSAPYYGKPADVQVTFTRSPS